MKLCCVIGCQCECEPNHRYCLQHYRERKREQARIRYLQKGNITYPCVCVLCGNSFNGWKRNSKFCSRNCYVKYTRLNSGNANNAYIKRCKTAKNEHRCIAEEILHRQLKVDEIVHHLDCNPLNNDVSNLVVMPRSEHVKLHSLLTKHRASLLKNEDVNHENCWDNLRDQITTAWLETAGANVIRISDIGQSSSRASSK